MVQRAARNWGTKSGLFHGRIMCINLAWVFFRIPETKHRTFAEIGILFEQKVLARDFRKAKVGLTIKTVTIDKEAK